MLYILMQNMHAQYYHVESFGGTTATIDSQYTNLSRYQGISFNLGNR